MHVQCPYTLFIALPEYATHHPNPDPTPHYRTTHSPHPAYFPIFPRLNAFCDTFQNRSSFFSNLTSFIHRYNISTTPPARTTICFTSDSFPKTCMTISKLTFSHSHSRHSQALSSIAFLIPCDALHDYQHAASSLPMCPLYDTQNARSIGIVTEIPTSVILKAKIGGLSVFVSAIVKCSQIRALRSSAAFFFRGYRIPSVHTTQLALGHHFEVGLFGNDATFLAGIALTRLAFLLSGNDWFLLALSV